jgi:hypothetical protein
MSDSNIHSVSNVMVDCRLEPQTAALQSYSLHGVLKCVGTHVNNNPSVIAF